ncbi:MAG: hypothetical protein WD207_01545 [Xanthobacteraceae bacterium]
MRLLFGIILGASLTIGAAYIHDTMYAAPSPTLPGVTRTLVNWDVASEVADKFTRFVRQQFERLTGR